MRNREVEEERLASVKKLEREALVSKVLEDDDRLEEKRLMRRMMMEQREREMEDSIIRVSFHSLGCYKETTAFNNDVDQ